MAESSTITRENVHCAAETAAANMEALRRENRDLRAYLRAFVRATYAHPRDCYGGQTPAQDAAGMHRVNPGFTYSFGLRELEGDDPIITGGQVMRAMELLGEHPELTPAEEAKNEQARAVLRDLQNTIALAVEALKGREGQSTIEAVLRAAAANSVNDGTAEKIEQRADTVKHALTFLENAAHSIPLMISGAIPNVPEAGRDDVQCGCVSTFGPNPERGACGGSGCVTAADKGPKPGDLMFRSEWEASREISHDEAREIARRLIASHFRLTDTETARASIPANPDRDDDLLICSYIKQQARKEVAGPGDLRSTPAMRQAADEARTAWLRDVDANDQIGALTAAIEAALATGGARG